MKTIKIENNPTIYSPVSLSSVQMQCIINSIFAITGKVYKAIIHDMADTQTLSFTLILQGKRLNKPDQRIIDAVIRGIFMGAGLGNPRISWPNLY